MIKVAWSASIILEVSLADMCSVTMTRRMFFLESLRETPAEILRDPETDSCGNTHILTWQDTQSLSEGKILRDPETSETLKLQRP